MHTTILAAGRRIRKRLALLAAASLVSALAAIATPGIAQASTVNSGDLVFQEAESSGAEYITISNSSGGSQTRLASGIVSDPTVSPDGSKIAYVKDHTYTSGGTTHGGYGIWAMNSDGSGDSQITFPDTGSSSSDDIFSDSEPRWSPDGTKIVFTRHKTDGLNYVYSMNADGSGATALSSGEAGSPNPSWSPSGSQIVYLHFVYTYPRVTVMDANGDNKHDVIWPNISVAYSYYPAWSPDGSRIYYWGNDSGDMKLLYLTSTDSFATAANSTEHTLLDAGVVNVNHLRVSADGADIYYDGINTTHLYKVDTSTHAVTTITPTGGNIY